jgi:glutamate-ammonia-ligase adenylyltransferase
LEQRLREAVTGTPLLEAVPTATQQLVERRGNDAACTRLDDERVRGLARMLVGNPQSAAFLSHRPELLERIAEADAATLAADARGFESASGEVSTGDLENDLDALRVLRHEQTCLAAVLDLGGIAPFRDVSYFLSVLAEAIAKRALHLARQSDRDNASAEFAVVGMGKVAGREFTYHSDLDLIFLFGGPPERLAETSRIGTRLISYLGTMTGAGIAYAVDTRLRPSGRQGVLVTSFSGYERYQVSTAEAWEHMAQLRARAIAGNVAPAQSVLDRVRQQILSRAESPWPYIAELRERVELERATQARNTVSFKTGAGGLMDVDFLASGGLLERGGPEFPALPSVPAMLSAVAKGEGVKRLLADYAFLRLVESRARWIAGRGIDEIRLDADPASLLAELVRSGLTPNDLATELVGTCERIRAAFTRVIEAGSISALAEG